MVYHEFTIKTKKIQYTVLEISTKKNLILKVSWWALGIGDPRNFYNSFFVYLNLL